MQSKRENHHPTCTIVHTFLNKLSVIVGNCDLLIEKMEPGSEHVRRLAVIREVAETAAKEIVGHQRQVEAEARGGRRPKAS